MRSAAHPDDQLGLWPVPAAASEAPAAAAPVVTPTAPLVPAPVGAAAAGAPPVQEDPLPPPPDEVLAARNAAEGRTGAAMFRPFAALEAMIAGTPCVLRDVREMWAAHPDERVPLAALRRPLTEMMGGHHVAFVAAVYTRAIAAADTAAVVWTPLLDALAASGRWPEPPTPEQARDAKFEDPFTGLANRRPVAAQVAPLGVWVRAQTSPEAVRPLLRFQARAVWDVVARELRYFDAALVTTLFSEPTARTILLANPALPHAMAALCWRRAIADGLEGRPARAGAANPTWSLTLVRETYRALTAAGHVLDASIFATLARWLDADPTAAERRRFRLGFHTPEDRERFRQEVLAVLLDPGIPTSAEALLRLYHAQVASHGHWWKLGKIVAHPNAPIAVARDMAARFTDPSLRRQLARTRFAAGDAEVRRLLAKSSAPEVLANLYEAGCEFGMEPREMERLLRKLVNGGEHARVLRLIQDTPRHLLLAFGPALLAGVLGAPDAAVREKAMHLAAQWPLPAVPASAGAHAPAPGVREPRPSPSRARR